MFTVDESTFLKLTSSETRPVILYLTFENNFCCSDSFLSSSIAIYLKQINFIYQNYENRYVTLPTLTKKLPLQAITFNIFHSLSLSSLFTLYLININISIDKRILFF